MRYEDYKEFKSNANKAQDSAKILFLTTINLEIFELPDHSEFKFNLELSQNKNQYFLCCQNQDEMLLWFEKLKNACVINHFDNIYQLKDRVGQGAFAQVFTARRHFDEEVFAVKVFDKKLVMNHKNNKLHMKSIIKEISIMRQFDNPIQIQLFEVFQTE